MSRNRAAGRLTFSTDVEAAAHHGVLQFIAVGTPPDEDGSADLQYVLADSLLEGTDSAARLSPADMLAMLQEGLAK